jgi:hypothetical protein
MNALLLILIILMASFSILNEPEGTDSDAIQEENSPLPWEQK